MIASRRSDPILRLTLVRGARPSAKSSRVAGHERRSRRAVAMGSARAESARPSSPASPAQVVPEEFARRWQRGRRPRRRAHLRRVGDGIDERGERGHTGDAVGDGVVHLDEEPHTLVRKAGQEPHLPQRPGPVQRAAAECLAGQQELPLVARRRHGVHADVLGDVERLGIRPHRPPQPRSGPVQDLTKARGQVQPPADGLAHGLDQESAIRVEQRSAVEGDKRPDVLGPALLLRPDQHEIRSGHAIEPGRPAFGVRRVTTSLHGAGCHLLYRNGQTTIVTLARLAATGPAAARGPRPSAAARGYHALAHRKPNRVVQG